MKTKKIQITTALAAAMLLSTSAGLCLSLPHATAEAHTQTYAATSLFTVSAGATTAVANQDLKFSFKNEADNAVTYNRDMAYKWYAVGEGVDDKTAPEAATYFSFEFSFASEINFDAFTVAFQSQEDSVTPNEKAENKVVFHADGRVTAENSKKEESELGTNVTLSGKDVEIAFGEGALSGEYSVTVTVDGAALAAGTFTNIKGAYVDATSSVVPLSLSAAFAEDAAADAKQTVSVRSLNGQSFHLNENGKVEDNAAPVLVINDELKSFDLGVKLLNFTYSAIDVCDSNVNCKTEYYHEKASDEEIEWKTLSSSTVLRETYDEEGNINEEEYVSIRFTLEDDGHAEGTYYAFWYAAPGAALANGAEGTAAAGMKFFKVVLDEEAPAYVLENGKVDLDLVDAYAEKVEIAATDLKAGSGYYFNLPSLADLITDNNTPYSGLSFTIYYKSDASSSTSTQSNVSYGSLRIPVNAAGGYQFRVVASDKAGNAMGGFTDDGDNAITKVTSSNVWDIREEQLPTFHFRANNYGVTIGEAKSQPYATIGASYSVSSFDIKGVSGHTDEYKLFYFKDVALGSITYSDLVALANEYAKKSSDANESQLAAFWDAAKAKYQLGENAKLVEIEEYDSNGPASDADEGWDSHDNRYNWTPSSRRFTPVEEGYYLVTLESVDPSLPGQHKFGYAAVFASYASDSVKGDSAAATWIENNVATVVFISIAVVSAIAIVVVLCIPSKAKADAAKDEKTKK